METSQHETRIQTGCLLILTAIAITYMLTVFDMVLIPFVLAVFLTYCLTPFVEMLIRWMKCPRSLAMVITILLGCIALLLIGMLVSAAVGEMTRNMEAYQEQLGVIIQRMVSALHLEERLGIEDPEQLYGKLFSVPAETAKNIFTGIINSVMAVVKNGLLVVIFMIFILSGKQIAKSPPGGVLHEIESSIKRYSISMILTSGVTGFLVGLTFSILGVDFAWMFGFLAFLLNFIPSIGSIIATILPLPVIILSPELSIPARILAIIIPTVILFCIGNLIQPRLMGKSLNLHPVTVLMSLMFFGVIWGIVGMLLATPVTAVLRMLFEKFDYTKPVAMIMAGNLDSISQ
jgi:AI-2 transport protein TqsA